MPHAHAGIEDDMPMESETKAPTGARSEDGGTVAEPTERLWSVTFVIIIMVTLCAFMTSQGVNSGTSVYIDLMGGSSTFAGIGAAAFSAAAALTRLLTGPVIDGRGRIIVLKIGAAVLIAGTIGPALTTDLRLFMVCRLLQGAGFAAATTAAATAAADILPASRLGEGIGYHGLGQAMAMAVGPALALFLVHTDPAENLYLGLSAAATLSLVLCMPCRYEKQPEKLPATSAYRMRWERQRAEEHTAHETTLQHDERTDDATSPLGTALRSKSPRPPKLAFHPSTFLEKRALPGTIPMLALTPAFGFSIYFAGVLGSSLGVSNAGLYYTLSAVSMIIIRLSSKRFMDRVAPIKITTFAIAFGMVGFGLLALASSQALAPSMTEGVFYLSGLIYGVFLGVAMPINQTVAVKNSPPERWGATNALYLLTLDVGVGVVCVFWGILNDTLGYTVAIVCAMAFMLVGYALAWICYPARDKQWRKRS